MSFYNSMVAATREPLAVLLIISVLFVELSFFKQPFAALFLSLLFFIRVITYIIQLQGGGIRFCNRTARSLITKTLLPNWNKAKTQAAK